MEQAVNTAAQVTDWLQVWGTILTGIVVTFIVLLILWFCVAMMGKVLSSISEKNKPAPVAKPVAPSTPAPVAPAPVVATQSTAPAVTIQADDEGDVIAAISAAISLMGNNLVVKSVKRTSDGAEIWASAGRYNNLR